MGGSVGKPLCSLQVWPPENKLETRISGEMQSRASRGTATKSFSSIVLKFPKIDASLRNCKAIFEEFDLDSNGAIDLEELNRSFRKLEYSFSQEEITELFAACDINDDMGINFNEFIVLLCLVYLLKNDPAALNANGPETQIGMPKLDGTFETLVDAFVFLDKNKNGYVTRDEMFQAINETGERSSRRIAWKRFEEMDWDKNGMVNFKEFLFAFTHWVGIEENEEE